MFEIQKQKNGRTHQILAHIFNLQCGTSVDVLKHKIHPDILSHKLQLDVLSHKLHFEGY